MSATASHLTRAHALAGDYLRAQLAGDSREALRLVDDALASGVSVRDLHLGVIEPAQREIGRLWQENAIGVAEEHLATSISQLVLARLYRHLPRVGGNGHVAVVACIEGEHHELGARMGADFLEMAGFDVRFLGANVPRESLVALVRRLRPAVVGLSIAMTFNIPALEATVAELRAAADPAPTILVGGVVVEMAPELAQRLDVCVFGGDAEALVARCKEKLGC